MFADMERNFQPPLYSPLGKEGLREDFKRSFVFKYVERLEEMIYYFTLIEVFIIV